MQQRNIIIEKNQLSIQNSTTYKNNYFLRNSMKGFIVDPTYRIEGSKAFVYFYGRLENGESFLTINETKPYFYIKKSDVKKAKESKTAFEHEECSMRDFHEKEVIKILVDVPPTVPKLRKEFEEKGIVCYEADIRFVYRAIIDKNILGCIAIDGEYKKSEYVDRVYKEQKITPAQFEPKLTVLSLDIETTIKADALFSVACISKDYKENKTAKRVFLVSEKPVSHAICFKTEKELLEQFIMYVREIDPDIITGWNVVDFDFKVLKERCRHYKIPFSIGRSEEETKVRIESQFFKESSVSCVGRQVLDSIALLKNSFIRLDDYKLDTAAHDILHKSKAIVFNSDKGRRIEELFKKHPDQLVEYNLRDAELVLEILEAKDIINLIIKRSMLTGMQIDRVSASIASLDSLYLRETKKRGYVCNSSSYAEREERIKGGFVRESSPGIYDYIIVCDFKSLYPSIIRTFNVDPLSFQKDGTVVAPNGAKFRDEEGILPGLIQMLWEQRDTAKKRKDAVASYAIKITMNSFYGVLASPMCRFYNPEIAGAITAWGQMIVKETAQEVEKRGHTVIYGDSITKDRFVTIAEKGKICIRNIEELFKKYAKQIITKNGKEYIYTKGADIKALTVGNRTLCPQFSQIIAIIRHMTKKKVFRVHQKFGETKCSEDHSLVVIKNNKITLAKPTEINNKPIAKVNSIPQLKKMKQIDLYELLKEYNYTAEYKGKIKKSKLKKNQTTVWFSWMKRKKPIVLRRFISTRGKTFEALCRILGAYIAEGSSSTRETTCRKCASISCSDKKWLEQLQNDYYTLFSNAKASIIPSMRKIRILKYNGKKITYADKTHKLQMMNEMAAIFFKVLCGQKSSGKKLPDFIYNVHPKYQLILLQNMIKGDGAKETKKTYSQYYRERHFRYDTNSLELISGLSLLLIQLGLTYSIQYRKSKGTYRIITSDKNNKNLRTEREELKYADYVYDLSVEDNHMFVDACGQILLHNTDSIFIETKAGNYADAHKIGEKIADAINKHFEKQVKEKYKRKSFLELEFEKVYSRFIMPKIRGTDIGAKKRYAGIITDGRHEHLDIVGLETVRRDWTECAKEFQMTLLKKIFAKQEVAAYIKKFVEEVKAGKHDALLVYKKALGKEVEEYTKTTPPHVKAARLLGKLDSNIIEYYITVNGPEPIQKLKSKIDYEHYIDKQLKPIADSILVFFNKTFDDVVSGKRQKSLFEY